MLGALTAALVFTANPVQAAAGAEAPQNLSARIVDGGVELEWDAPAVDDVSVDGYEILRRRTNRGEQRLTTLVSDTGNTETTYTDATATEPGVRYAYRVKAIRNGVRSAWSGFATVIIESAPVVAPVPPRLVGNLDQSPPVAAMVSGDEYNVGFRLGRHGQGYQIDSVSIDLAAAPQSLSVAVWIAGVPGIPNATTRRFKLFDLVGPDTLRAGLNEFTAPAGSWVYQNVNHYIELSDFGASLSVHETTSTEVDPGGETGAVLYRDPESSGSGVLRLALEGSRRDRGVLYSGFAAPLAASVAQEIISIGDICCFELNLGAADRYLVRSLSWAADDTTPNGGAFGLPFEVDATDGTNQFNLTIDRDRHQHSGMNLWKAPQGATLEGNRDYDIEMNIVNDPGSESLRGGVVLTRMYAGEDAASPDRPNVGATVVQRGDVLFTGPPLLAIEGEPLYAMVSNVGQTDNGHVELGAAAAVLSQAFTTGSGGSSYRFRGIGVNIEGSDDTNSNAQVPDGPASVSAAVHAAGSNGQPGGKLFDLVGADEYAAGRVAFFEAPPDAVLEPDADYVMVWSHVSGTKHRLRKTSGDNEDSGAFAGFGIATAFHVGADLDNLSEDSSDNALEIAVYGETVYSIGRPEGALVSNVQRSVTFAPAVDADSDYNVGFRLGRHGQGYQIDSVSIDLAAAPQSLSVSVWIAGVPGIPNATTRRFKLFDLVGPNTLRAGLNEFTAPAGSWVYQNVNHYIVLSDFGASLSVNETASVNGTTSTEVDPGGETGAVLYRDPESSGSGVLRLALEGSRRDRGVLYSGFAAPLAASVDQEIISIGDICCFELNLGAADRYLVRSLSWAADDTTPNGGAFGLPFEVDATDGTNQFNLTIDRDRHQHSGMNLWKAPQGATLEGNRDYDIEMNIVNDPGSESLRGGVVLTRMFAGEDAASPDRPNVGATVVERGDVLFTGPPLLAIEGEPLYAMVSNVGQTDNGHVELGAATAAVLSQAFTTGSGGSSYRFRGIGVNIEGSDDTNSNAQVPDGPASVSAAVHAAGSNGQPGGKLFDLVGADEYAAGRVAFFEAPPDAVLEPDADYVMVWSHVSGTKHRLRKTSGDNEDSGAFAGFGIATAFHVGADLDNLSEDSSDNALEIAVYGETVYSIGRPEGALVSNVQRSVTFAPAVDADSDYNVGFRLGRHGQGYEIDSVSIDLAAAPQSLSVAVWIAGVPGIPNATTRRFKLFDLVGPDTLRAGLNEFTAPAGSWVYQNVNHYIVLSDFGASLSVNETASVHETTSTEVDPGGETGAVLYRDPESSGSGVLRLALEGSRRDRGVLYSGFAAPLAASVAQEVISIGDTCCFELNLGAADRYLVRSLSWAADDTTPTGGAFGLPFEVDATDGTNQFNLTIDRDRHQHSGMNLWKAPQGATLEGNRNYDIEMNIVNDPGSESLRGGVVLTRMYAGEDAASPDRPNVGATVVGGGDVDLTGPPLLAIEGEPLYAMVSNVGQSDNGHVELGAATAAVLSQAFTTGSGGSSYRFRGIGVNIEGSDDTNGDAQVPDGPASVSAAVHAAGSNGQPGGKLFDLVGADEYAAGRVAFFEAPPDAVLEPDADYVMVWSHVSGTKHRLRKTSGDNEDSGAFTGFGIATAFHVGADLDNLSEDSSDNALEIAVYGYGEEAYGRVDGGFQVTEDWLHVPEGFEVGDQFRLVFIGGRTDAVPVDIKHYNAVVQAEAAKPYNDRIVRSIARAFKAVACTGADDARANTGMTDSRGVPLHWLDGGWDDHPTLIAHSYDQFYGGQWVNTGYGAYSTGNSLELHERRRIWTGCHATGAKHPDAYLGSTLSMGMVAAGHPNHPTEKDLGPLGTTDPNKAFLAFDRNLRLTLYAVSPVLTVVE